MGLIGKGSGGQAGSSGSGRNVDQSVDQSGKTGGDASSSASTGKGDNGRATAGEGGKGGGASDNTSIGSINIRS